MGKLMMVMIVRHHDEEAAGCTELGWSSSWHHLDGQELTTDCPLSAEKALFPD